MDDLLNQQTAAEMLQAALPEPEGYWRRFLANNRRTDRSPTYRIPIEKVGGGILYRADEIERFVAIEKSRRLGVVNLGAPATGRKLDCEVTAQVDEATGKHFAQLIIRNPLMVFRLEAEQVRALAREFANMANAFDRWSKA